MTWSATNKSKPAMHQTHHMAGPHLAYMHYVNECMHVDALFVDIGTWLGPTCMQNVISISLQMN